ncbi:uncharacterized protein LOC123558120 [Mercenaria mercenaria]|uniref:uncharacterized protein LOC123558120 n=1 Tax=Mercenaria mercenaria TaxID=6596 RepID=UPI00234F97C7|nr:uncharacterized protein LOC123558120 [Mercenaria mercenaria]
MKVPQSMKFLLPFKPLSQSQMELAQGYYSDDNSRNGDVDLCHTQESSRYYGDRHKDMSVNESPTVNENLVPLQTAEPESNGNSPKAYNEDNSRSGDTVLCLTQESSRHNGDRQEDKSVDESPTVNEILVSVQTAEPESSGNSSRLLAKTTV